MLHLRAVRYRSVFPHIQQQPKQEQQSTKTTTTTKPQLFTKKYHYDLRKRIKLSLKKNAEINKI